MDAIEYTEKAVDAALREVRASYDTLHDRAYKFATLTMGAAGAVSIYALGKLGAEGYLWQVLPMALLALWWFAGASLLLLRGAATREMTAGVASDKIRERIGKHEVTSGADQALNLTRWDQMAAVDIQIEAFSKANIERAKALDSAYRWMVSSPLAGLAGLALAYGLR